MKTLFTVLFLIIATCGISQSLVWANKYGGSQNDNLNLVTVDSTGNVYTAGKINTGMSIAKYDGNGILLWADTLNVTPYDIKVDVQGNLFIVGQFFLLKDFDPGAGVFNMGDVFGSQNTSFLLKLNTNGGFVYAKQIGGYPNSMCLDVAENIFITGTFSNSQDFDPNPTVTNTQTSVDGYSMFITKLDNVGNFDWNQVIGKTTVSTSGLRDNFIAKYNTSSQVGINELNKTSLSFSVYPNPTNSVINIETLVFNKTVTTIEITDVLGKTILHKSITENVTQLNVTDFTKGIYFVTLKSDNKTSTQKLIID